ncbi:hypothetical protein IX307_002262 [Bacteroides pyogenes]|uniref:DUF5018 domain-containing protein n=1 Tax=Bacteroides pyogenes TaxID=310300 RepID=UPI001BA4DC17|nr:DUF5018 domain-containing protein [Bacteroides pyogenes]MBR8721056.1 hypothetical protein [Bacteroides pyogenes]MBR8787925.1 hypothetical protein [Bacteroides pyogenes]MBR8793398.1 hypothetical protein [Bacteroides pyogenes]
MKNKILSIISVIALFIGMSACHSPEEFKPNLERNGINNLIASFPDDDRDENRFTSEIDYQNRVITVVFPYNYPRLSDNVLEISALKKMRVIADLDNNVYISPSLLFLDFTKENFITVKEQDGKSVKYKIIAEIRKSAECVITKFDLKKNNLSGIINEETKTISLISLEDIGEDMADVVISHGAVILPDPTKETLNYDQEQKLTVTAQNGTTSSVYIVKKEIPNKIPAGLRPNSAKLLWARKLVDVGITSSNMATGFAVTKDYVVINDRNNNKAFYLNKKTGSNEGFIDISAFAGSLTNFYVTADEGDNILFTNLTPGGGSNFTIWRLKGVEGAVEKYIEFPTTIAMGRKISIRGSLDGNAIITAPHYSTQGEFSYWQVIGGVLQSQRPEKKVAQGLGSWGNNADLIYSDPTDITSDYFAAFYTTPRSFCWFDGKTNAIKAQGPEISANWVQNAVDYVIFNNTPFAVSNSVNSFSWGKDDCIYLFDLSSGSLSNEPINFGDDGLGINGNYGAKALGNVNSNGTGDVAFKVSEDGYYLYIYFMFTNGYVGCVRCDCIDM